MKTHTNAVGNEHTWEFLLTFLKASHPHWNPAIMRSGNEVQNRKAAAGLYNAIGLKVDLREMHFRTLGFTFTTIHQFGKIQWHWEIFCMNIPSLLKLSRVLGFQCHCVGYEAKKFEKESWKLRIHDSSKNRGFLHKHNGKKADTDTLDVSGRRMNFVVDAEPEEKNGAKKHF